MRDIEPVFQPGGITRLVQVIVVTTLMYFVASYFGPIIYGLLGGT